VVSTGVPYLIVPAATPDAVGRATPDPRLLPEILRDLGVDGCYVFSLDEDGGGAKARMFGLSFGVVEDPATGSAAGPLGAYLAEQGAVQPGRLVISQGVELGRPSTLLVDVQRTDDGSWSIFVGGGVVRVGEGEF